MKAHVHQESTVCSCSSQADTPDEQCVKHGHSWPPRCATCGQMMKWEPESDVKMSSHEQ